MEGLILVASTIVLINGVLLIVSADIIVFNNETPHQIEVEFRDMPSLFGGIIPQEGIQAMVVYANPPEACDGLQPPPNNVTNFTGKWAVLIRRYGCTFEKKIRNAQNASYHIAIVHNVNSTDLEPMSASNPHGIFIPSIFVGSRAGELIKENYQWSNGYFVTIDDASPDDINKHLLVPFAIVVGICFFIMLGFMVVKCIQDRRRAHRHRLPTSTLKKIPTAKFQKGDPYDTCAICIEDYVEGDKLRILPCSHAYHSKCIDPWLTRNRRVCPICKRKVFAAGEKPPAGGSSDSDSDTEGIVDDRTPLVLPSGNNTQGGTFDNMSENPLVRQGRPLWHRNSYTSSSATSDGSSTTSDGGSINFHAADVISNSSGPVINDSAEVENSTNTLIVPGTSIVPINGDIHHPPMQNPLERRGARWYYFWN